MKDERELLEMAAKAAGYTLVWGDNYIVDGDNIDCTDLPYVKSDQQDEADWFWNPIADDGDALRLAVKLRIDLSMWIMRESVTAKTHIGAGRGIPLHGEYKRPQNDHSEPHNGDPYAATRRAIVRAAAAIGKAMP